MPDQTSGLVQPSNELAVVVTTLERKCQEVFSDMMHMDKLCVRHSNLMKTDIPSNCPICTVAGDEEQ